jgi:ABC-2 type transport system ATP-binding protein
MVCDRVAIVDRGRVVRSGRLEELLGGLPELRVTVDRVDQGLLEIMAQHGRILDTDDTTVVLGVEDLSIAAGLTESLVHNSYRVYAMVPSHQSLEDVFVSLVESTSDR